MAGILGGSSARWRDPRPRCVARPNPSVRPSQLPVLAWGAVGELAELAVEVADVVEADTEGNIEYLAVAVAQVLHGCADTTLSQVGERCESCVALETATEMGLADAGLLREVG